MPVCITPNFQVSISHLTQLPPSTSHIPAPLSQGLPYQLPQSGAVDMLRDPLVPRDRCVLGLRMHGVPVLRMHTICLVMLSLILTKALMFGE